MALLASVIACDFAEFKATEYGALYGGRAAFVYDIKIDANNNDKIMEKSPMHQLQGAHIILQYYHILANHLVTNVNLSTYLI